jgi:putative transposase
LLKAVKAVKFGYRPNTELTGLFLTFRSMCNDAIRIAFTENARNRFDLISKAYARLKECGLHTHYIMNACEVAYSAYRNKNRKSDPRVKKPFLKLDNQTYRLGYLLLRIPTAPRHFLYLTLDGSLYQRSFLADQSLKRGSVTITETSVIISFSKEVTPVEPRGRIVIDINERNLTCSDTLGTTRVFDTSTVAEIKERYKEIRGKIAKRTNEDARIKRRLLAKYGKRERNRTPQAIHRVTKSVVDYAATNSLVIVMEKLTGIRKLYRRGNGQGRSFRCRMNSWSFNEAQRQVEYKANWKAVPVVYVNPRGTSRKCPECGSPLIEVEGRRLFCPSCRQTGDRDVIASKNLMVAPLVRANRPPVCSSDGERDEADSNPLSRRAEVT